MKLQDIWYLTVGDIIRYNLVDYTVIRFVENDDDFFILLYNHNNNNFELISEDNLNFKFRILYTISEHEKVETFFTKEINEVFEEMFKKFKDILDFDDSDLKKFCKEFESDLIKKNISLKDKIIKLNQKYQK